MFWVADSGQLNLQKENIQRCNNVNLRFYILLPLVITLVLGLLIIVVMKIIVLYLDKNEDRTLINDINTSTELHREENVSSL